MENQIKKPGLYNSEFEHDACGIGAIVSINGIKTHQTVSDAYDSKINEWQRLWK